MKHRRCRKGGMYKMMFVDVKKAHLNAKLEEGEHHYVRLPKEAGAAEGKVGRLKRWLYGMRGAAQGWEKEWQSKMESIGFVKGKSTVAVMRNEKEDIQLVVHGDDFTFLGPSEGLKRVLKSMKGCGKSRSGRLSETKKTTTRRSLYSIEISCGMGKRLFILLTTNTRGR